jgi:hypothetical protein
MKDEKLLLSRARYEYFLTFDAASFKMAEILIKL